MTHQNVSTRQPAVQAPANRSTLGLFLAGLVVTVAGLTFAIVDQNVLGGLDRHLHEIYDPIGKSGQPLPLYIYLFSVGILGVLSWLLCLRLVARRSRRARAWSISVLALSLVVVAPLFLTEYGHLVFPLQLSAFPVVAWVLGLVGVLTLRKSRGHDGRSGS